MLAVEAGEAGDTEAAPYRDPDPAGTSRGATRLQALGANRLLLAVVLIPLGLALAAHAYWDRPFFPDSRYYLAMAYRDLGYDAASALRRQVNATGWPAPPWYFSSADPVWRMVQPRLLYPLLSAPFVWAAGPRLGILAVPALSSLVTVAVCTRLAQRWYGPIAALLAAGALSASITVTDIAVALTDPLAMALIALMLLNLPIRRPVQGSNFVWLGVLSAALCLTRQTTPVVLGLAAAGLVWALMPTRVTRTTGQRRDWLTAMAVICAVTVCGQIVITTLAPYDASNQFLLASHQTSMSGALEHLPQTAWRIIKTEAALMARTDIPLTMLVIGAAIAVLARAREVDTWLLVGGAAGTCALMLANGIPSFLRYESVLFPLVTLAAAGLLGQWLPESMRQGPQWPGGISEKRPPKRQRVALLIAASGAVGISAIAWSAAHGSASLVGAVPTAPAAAAALAGIPGTAEPVKAVSPQTTLRAAIKEAVRAYQDHDVEGLIQYFDWRHPLRYTPAGVGDPGWSDRAADGSAVIRYGDFVELAPVEVAAGLGRSGRCVPQSLKVRTRQIGEYGEDVTFTVADRSGRVHRGRATILYPTRKSGRGTITELVYES